jgi:hypothetical protein
MPKLNHIGKVGIVDLGIGMNAVTWFAVLDEAVVDDSESKFVSSQSRCPFGGAKPEARERLLFDGKRTLHRIEMP